MNCHFVNFSFSLSLTHMLTSSVQRKFAQGTNITTVVVHGLPSCDKGRLQKENIVEKRKFKFIPIFKDKCINYNSIGYSCILFLKIP